MNKSKFSSIAKKWDLTFKEAINLVAIKSEVMRSEKFDDQDWFYINSDMGKRQYNKFESLKNKGFIDMTNDKVAMNHKGNEFPLHIGAVSYLGGFDDEDILENIISNK